MEIKKGYVYHIKDEYFEVVFVVGIRRSNNVDIAKIRRTPGIGSPNILGI